MGGKKKKKKTNKLLKERPYFELIATTRNISQAKFMLKQISPQQYTVLREIALNACLGNLPLTKHQRHITESMGRRLEKLCVGKLHKNKLPHLYPYLKVLIKASLQYYAKHQNDAGQETSANSSR